MRKSNWRQQHEDFITAIRSAKQCTLAIKEGRPLPPPSPPSINLGVCPVWFAFDILLLTN